GVDDELSAIDSELHGAVAVGAVRGHAPEGRERLGRWMTITVLRADRDERGRWLDRRDERVGIRRRRAVMRRDIDTSDGTSTPGSFSGERTASVASPMRTRAPASSDRRVTCARAIRSFHALATGPAFRPTGSSAR